MIALCAPGKKFETALALVLMGERVDEIREHPYLAGLSAILVDTDALKMPCVNPYDLTWLSGRPKP